MLDNDPIPLEDGPASGLPIIPDSGTSGGESSKVRQRRASLRKHCDRVHVCFSPEYPSGVIDNVECRVINISRGGFAIEFDRHLAKGTRGTISYRAISGRPVSVGCRVLDCVALSAGRYRLNLGLDRKLQVEEAKPASLAIGREIAPGVRPRKLHSAGVEPRNTSIA